jgi:hypothetical protein
VSTYQSFELVEVSPGVYDLGGLTYDTEKVLTGRFLTQLLSYREETTERGNSFQSEIAQAALRTSSAIRNLFGIGMLEIIMTFRRYEPAEVVREGTLTDWTFSDTGDLRISAVLTIDDATINVSAGV